MPQFMNQLEVKFFEEGASRSRWMLTQPFSYKSDLWDEVITVPQGFITDLASVPRLPLAYWVAGGVGNKAAVVHDWLYSKYCEILMDRKVADKIFLEAMKLDGVWGWRRWLMYTAVSGFASKLWRDD